MVICCLIVSEFLLINLNSRIQHVHSKHRFLSKTIKFISIGLNLLSKKEN